MALFETFTTDRSNQINDVKKLIVNLKEQLDKANENLTELQKAEQAELSTVQATQSALSQLEAAISMTAQVFGADGIQEIRDRVNGLLDTVALLESSETGDDQETTNEVNDETTEAQTPDNQANENPENTEQPTITVESIPVDATESDDEQSNPETDEAIDEKELRDGVEDWINTEHHATVRKWAREWFDIDTTDIKIANIRNLIREKVEEFKYNDVLAFWEAVNARKFNETK